MGNRDVSINFRFNVPNQFYVDQIKSRVNSMNLYINNIEFSDFAFSDFLDLLSEIFNFYSCDFDISVSE